MHQLTGLDASFLYAEIPNLLLALSDPPQALTDAAFLKMAAALILSGLGR